ncbi:uncharacterized protein LOC131167468 [Malania oleifera]|uniref:uncharacterized protein LOC131167468 n=1 Tax=Malania oleifera TaxID=397392 RepID=UPI0025AE8CAC|nr:uncharacterized protein LOC131167468 [Malania oleifera]
MMVNLNFPDQMIAWVMECVTTTSFSISLNGRLNGFFKGKKGLRLLKSLEGNFNFKFHPKSKELKIIHLVFADDLMLFSKGDAISVRFLMDCLNELLTANSLKSNLYQAGMKPQVLEGILNQTGIKEGKFPFKYLGVPLLPSKLNAVHYRPLVDRIARWFKGWPGSTLTYAGRLEIINSIVQGFECFWLAIFPIPLNVLNQVIKLCRVFLWGGRRKPLVAWSEVYKPKDEGGLGVFDLKSWNRAFLTKALWNVQAKKDSLWIKWIHQCYLKDTGIWYAATKKEDSPLFKRLVEIKDQLVQKAGSVAAAIENMQRIGNEPHMFYDFWRENSHKMPWIKSVWLNGITPKYAFCLWLGWKGRLPTCDKVYGDGIDPRCTFCNRDMETLDHIFFGCKYSAEVMDNIRNWLGIKRAMTTINAAVKWLHKEAKGFGVHSTGKKIGLATIVYLIWHSRNRKRIENHVIPPIDLCKVIQRHIYRVMFDKFDMFST